MNWVISLALIILLSCAISSCKLDLSQAAIGNCLGRLPPAPLATSLRLVCHKRVKGEGTVCKAWAKLVEKTQADPVQLTMQLVVVIVVIAVVVRYFSTPILLFKMWHPLLEFRLRLRLHLHLWLWQLLLPWATHLRRDLLPHCCQLRQRGSHSLSLQMEVADAAQAQPSP